MKFVKYLPAQRDNCSNSQQVARQYLWPANAVSPAGHVKSLQPQWRKHMNRRRGDAPASRYRSLLGVSPWHSSPSSWRCRCYAAEVMRVRHSCVTRSRRPMRTTSSTPPFPVPASPDGTAAGTSVGGQARRQQLRRDLRIDHAAHPADRDPDVPVPRSADPGGRRHLGDSRRCTGGQIPDQYGTAYILAPLKWAGLLPSMPGPRPHRNLAGHRLRRQ